MNGIIYSISEASERLGNISYRTLHYYEQKVGLKINRDGSGNRIYTERDIDLFDKIIELKKKGMSLDGIRAIFQEKGFVEPEENKNIVVMDEKAFEMKELFIEEIRIAVAEQMKEELLFTNNKIDQIMAENIELKEEINKLLRQNDEHYNKIDQQLTAWRENNSQDKHIPWYKRLFK